MSSGSKHIVCVCVWPDGQTVGHDEVICKQAVMSVCIVNRMRLKGQGFNSRQGKQIYLPSSSGPALGPNHPPLYWVPEFWAVMLTTTDRGADKSLARPD